MAAKQKILVVDDDSNIAELVSLYLIKEGYDTERALNGREALRQMQKFSPNLVILDVMMPEMDGYETCREIRKQSSVPVIMLTAKGETFDKVLGLELERMIILSSLLTIKSWLPVSRQCCAGQKPRKPMSRNWYFLGSLSISPTILSTIRTGILRCPQKNWSCCSSWLPIRIRFLPGSSS